MRLRLLLPLLILLVSACTDGGPIDLPDLEQRARDGETAAIERLVELLGRSRNDVNSRAYGILVDLGEPAVKPLLGRVDAAGREQREHVIAALGNLQVGAAVPGIIEVLGDPRLGRRYVAAWALGEIGDPGAIPALVRALDDGDPEVRRYATRSLIRFNREAVPALVEALEAASPAVRAGAIRALGDIADPRALEPLLELADGPHREEVCLALGKLRDPRAESALIRALADPDWRVRMNAAMALGPLGGPEAGAALEKTMEDEVHVVREWSARSLEMITGEHVTYRNEQGEYVAPYNIYH